MDWGEVRVRLRQGPNKLHIFVLTLGFSRRGFYWAFPDQRLSQFLEAYERAFAHFGGLTREHLYDRPRTVCYPNSEGRVVWNPTFKAFTEYWGFEPRLCRAYRAQTKGKVESGVKYVKRNFMPGRAFVDTVDFQEQLTEWNATIADARVHGTTHEVPRERFAREQAHLLPTHRHPSFLTDATVSRIVARAGSAAGIQFPVTPHQLRHACEYYLANKQVPTRTIQEYLGHRSIANTMRYTALSAAAFKGLWD